MSDPIIATLAQAVKEDSLNPANIIQWLISDIKQLDLGKQYTKATSAIHKYLESQYSYDSKTIRVTTLKSNYTSTGLVAYSLLAIAIHKDWIPIQGIAAKLSKYLHLDKIMDKPTAIKCSAEILGVIAVETKLIHIQAGAQAESGYMSLKTGFKITKTTLNKITEMHHPEPMECNPTDWTKNNQGGYLSLNHHIHLGRYTHKDESCLDVINKLQQVEYVLDPFMNSIKDGTKKGKDKEAQKQWKQYKKYSREQADTLMGKSLWFVWKYDLRGRMYSSGYGVNIQSDEYRKSLISFSKKELVCDTLQGGNTSP